MAVDARLRSPRRPHADLRLRADARGCDCGVRQERAARLLRFNDLAICPCRRYLNGRHSGHGTQQKRCSMTRPILAVLVLAISIPPLYAQGTILHTDRSGYTTGIDGNPTVNTYMHYIRHEQSLWHSLLKMPDHRSLRPRDRDRQRLARGRLELNNIGPVGLR